MRFLSLSLPIILAVILTMLAVTQSAVYPMPPDGIAAEKYDGFSGVLTISIEKELTGQFPRLQRWINEITNLFEKSNRGIYLRCVQHEAGQLSTVTQGAQPADIVLCSAGNFSGENWISLRNDPLLPAFFDEDDAIAIAAGGYVLGYRGTPPESLTLLPDNTLGYCDALSTAWIALCEGFSPLSTAKRTISAPDIGLIPSDTPEPTAALAAGTELARRNLYMGDSSTLFDAFLAGEILAMPLNQEQASKINALQDEGLQSEICFLNAASFTDLAVYAAIPRSSRSDSTGRAAAAQDFIAMLLSDEAQTRLTKHRMFPTAVVESIYSGVPGLQQIEEALRRSDCVVQRAGESAIQANIDAFLDGGISARECMRTLRNRR